MRDTAKNATRLYLLLALLFSSVFWGLIIWAAHLGAAGGSLVLSLMWCPALAARISDKNTKPQTAKHCATMKILRQFSLGNSKAQTARLIAPSCIASRCILKRCIWRRGAISEVKLRVCI